MNTRVLDTDPMFKLVIGEIKEINYSGSLFQAIDLFFFSDSHLKLLQSS